MMTAIPPSGKPQKLLFDLGGVLVKIKSVSRLWPGTATGPGGLTHEQLWVGSDTVHAYETGKIRGMDAFYRSARDEIGISIPEHEFNDVFLDLIGELFAETIPLLSALKGHYPLYLLSNIGEDHWLHCRDRLGLGPFFDQVFLSCEMGIMKPDPRIFKRTVQQIDDNPENIWYFDDREENVMTAARFGISGWTTRGGMILLKDLVKIGLINGTGEHANG